MKTGTTDPQTPQKQRGVLMVELALTLPIVLIVVFAIVQYSVLLGAMMILNNTVSEAARATTVYRNGASLNDYEQVARDSMTNMLPVYVGEFKTHVQSNVQSFACGDSTCLRLTLSYPDYSDQPLLTNLFALPMPENLTAVATTRVEPDAL